MEKLVHLDIISQKKQIWWNIAVVICKVSVRYHAKHVYSKDLLISYIS